MSLSGIPKRHPDAGVHRVGGQWLAATLDGRMHTFEHGDGSVSEVGERIIELVDGRRSVQDIVQCVTEEFEVEAATAQADTVEFIALLVEKQLIVL